MGDGSWRNPRVWIGLSVSVVAVAVSLYRVDLAEAREALRQADYVWLVPALVFAIGALLVRALRWRVLFFPLRLSAERLFSIMVIGYLVTTLLPLRLGDLARAHLVGEIEEKSKTRALTTVAVEHLVDALALLVILLLLSPLVVLEGWVRAVMMGVASLLILSAALIGLTWFRRGESLAALDSALKQLPERWARKIHELVEGAIDGFSAIGSLRASLAVAGWSVALWLAGGLMMWMTLLAFNLPQSFVVAMMMVAMSSLALTIPSSPGFIGVYHAIIIESLVGLFGASRGEAASFAVVTHLLLFLPPVVLGSLVILREPTMWDRLLHWHRSEQRSSSAADQSPRAAN